MTLRQYRRFDRAQETLVRAAMPRTSASDPAPLVQFGGEPQHPRTVTRWNAGRRFVQKASFTMSEVWHA